MRGEVSASLEEHPEESGFEDRFTRGALRLREGFDLIRALDFHSPIDDVMGFAPSHRVLTMAASRRMG